MLKTLNKKCLPKHYYYNPDWIVLGVNNVCNLHCKMCDVGTKNMDSNFAKNLVGTHPINMPMDLIKRVIDGTAKYFPKSKLAYAFTEPLVYPHLLESLEYANSRGLKTVLTTNALTLSQKAEGLVKAGLNELFVSLDGPPNIHNHIRGYKSSFQKAIEGIELLNQFKYKPIVKIICAITEWNIGHLKELINTLKELSIAEIGFMHTQFISKEAELKHGTSPWHLLYPAQDSNIDVIDFNNMDLDTLIKEIDNINASSYPFKIYFSPNITTKSDLERYYFNTNEILGSYCHAVYSSIMIKSDGSVIPAHGRCYNLKLGNVYQSSLKSIWHSNVLKNLRSDLNKAGGLFPACSRCCSAS